MDQQGVAGINLPAFVERPAPGQRRTRLRQVSPGLTSRPSLSVALFAAWTQADFTCRRD